MYGWMDRVCTGEGLCGGVGGSCAWDGMMPWDRLGLEGGESNLTRIHSRSDEITVMSSYVRCYAELCVCVCVRGVS